MSAPVGHTCGEIDSVIEDIKCSLQEVDVYDDLDKANDALKEIDYHLYWSTTTMETIRSANSSLRDWGTDLESEISDLTDKIRNLEQELAHSER